MRKLAGVAALFAIAAAAPAGAAGLAHGRYAAASGFVNTATQAFPLFAGTKVIGALAPSRAMHVVVGLVMRNRSAVDTLLRAQLTPGNPMFRRFLTPFETAAAFGPRGAQVQAVASYLTRAGFTNVAVTPDNMLLTADGTAAIASKAFNTQLDVLSIGGKRIFANVTAAQVPASLGGIVAAVVGLSDYSMHTAIRYARDRSRIRQSVLGPHGARANPQSSPQPCALPTSNLCLINSYTATGFQLAYDAPQATGGTNARRYTGKNTNIAIFAEGHVANLLTDLIDAENANVPPLPHVPVTVVYAGVPSPDVSGQSEFDLDTQASTGIAGDVKGLYLYVATSLTDADIAVDFDRFKTDDTARAGSASFGECEIFPATDGAMLLDDAIFEQAAAQGQTIFSASGDNGTTCPVVAATGVPGTGLPFQSYPGTSPYVVSVGGTTLVTNTPTGSYNSEIAWIGTGGGSSTEESSPFWQQGVVPAYDNPTAGLPGVATFKAVPDVAMDGDPDTGAVVYVNGTAEGIGGTSLASPLLLGVWARLETFHGNRLGFASPLIYQEYKNFTMRDATTGMYVPPTPAPGTVNQFIGGFHDILVGTNGLLTLPGYDQTTGLGTFDISTQFQDLPTSYPS